jgi:hypothetical protein
MPPADNIDVDIAESHITLEDRIRRRAYQIHLSHPDAQHRALDDWLEAEREILGETPKDSAEDRATVVGSARRPGIVL